MTFRLQERNQNTFHLHCIPSFFRGSPIWGTVCKYMQFLKYLFYSPTSIIRNQQFNSLNSLLGCRSRIENKKQWRCKDKNRFTDLSEESSWMSPHIRSVVSGHSGEWWSLSFIKSSLDGKKNMYVTYQGSCAFRLSCQLSYVSMMVFRWESET